MFFPWFEAAGATLSVKLRFCETLLLFRSPAFFFIQLSALPSLSNPPVFLHLSMVITFLTAFPQLDVPSWIGFSFFVVSSPFLYALFFFSAGSLVFVPPPQINSFLR